MDSRLPLWGAIEYVELYAGAVVGGNRAQWSVAASTRHECCCSSHWAITSLCRDT
jgi:hypothetical protein